MVNFELNGADVYVEAPATMTLVDMLREELGVKSVKKGKETRVRALATLYDRRTGFAREILQDLSRFFGPSLYNTVIHVNVKLREASSYGVPITEYDRKARGCQDYLALADEVLGEGESPRN